ncbi:molybdenum cofactor biosynthesis protein MoaE [Paenibacillus sp. YN15]|uniref:molybdenum cofactor biosynthesis protein n=1 Tax=Paenibacillus sp. YN15 TaxID=1742774 RepID=UPI000DCBB6A5|nr:molybdenum cofactor biosynthesis protein MoaE [Paenibacillus sp. YN15]RAV06536.1 molybdopterin converting factor [Paenibacillus sp. YN15]
MQLTIQIFAGLADKMGGSAVTVTTGEDRLTAGGLKQLLAREYPHAASSISVSFLARNHAYAQPEDEIREGDELALIPPVSGGSPAWSEQEPDSGERFELTRQPLEPERIAAKTAHPNCGANLAFTGTVREYTGDLHTEALEYEAYAPMALATLRQIGDEVAARWPGALCAISHRLGLVEAGEASVVIAVSAPHRDACYEASRYAIERLKQIVPIWKKEAGQWSHPQAQPQAASGTRIPGRSGGGWNPLILADGGEERSR